MSPAQDPTLLRILLLQLGEKEHRTTCFSLHKKNFEIQTVPTAASSEGNILNISPSTTLGDGPVTSGLSLVFRVRAQQGWGDALQKEVSPISPCHHQQAPDSSEMWAAIMRNSSSPQCQHFSSWCPDGPLGSGRRQGQRPGAESKLVTI